MMAALNPFGEAEPNQESLQFAEPDIGICGAAEDQEHNRLMDKYDYEGIDTQTPGNFPANISRRANVSTFGTLQSPQPTHCGVLSADGV